MTQKEPPNKDQEESREHRRFWNLGMRTWKTVIAVFLSMLLDSLREGAMPFYAAIAAIVVVQQNRKSSLKAAVNREIATVVGGFFGLVFLLLESVFGHADPPVLRYALLALTLLPLISFSVYVHKPECTFLMCVVFLSVALLHDSDVSPYLFALNRIIDTSIGIGIALAVNEIRIKRPKDSQKQSDNP